MPRGKQELSHGNKCGKCFDFFALRTYLTVHILLLNLSNIKNLENLFCMLNKTRMQSSERSRQTS